MQIEQIESESSDHQILKIRPPLGLDQEQEFIDNLLSLVNKPIVIIDLLDVHADEDVISMLLKARLAVKLSQPRTVVLIVVTHRYHEKILLYNLNHQSNGVGYSFDNLEAAKEFSRDVA